MYEKIKWRQSKSCKYTKQCYKSSVFVWTTSINCVAYCSLEKSVKTYIKICFGSSTVQIIYSIIIMKCRDRFLQNRNMSFFHEKPTDDSTFQIPRLLVKSFLLATSTMFFCYRHHLNRHAPENTDTHICCCWDCLHFH